MKTTLLAMLQEAYNFIRQKLTCCPTFNLFDSQLNIYYTLNYSSTPLMLVL